MKRFILALIMCATIVSVSAQKKYPTMFAHRGCWSKNDANEFVVPENSLPAVAMAKTMGYKGIECDVHYTKDKRMVILHDATLNRTMRRASDYSKLDKPVRLDELTFEELRRDYVLESENPEWRTPIPTLEELLSECKKQGVMPMLHSALMESYHVAQEMFGNEWICFTGGVEHLQKVREFSDCIILLSINDGSAEENIARLEQIGGRCGISTMKYQLYTPEFCKALTDRGYIVQASIFPTPYEAIAQRNGITYQLSDYSIMPTHKPIHKGRGVLKATTHSATWEWSCEEKLERGALTLDIEFKGEVEIIINGKQKYTLSHDDFSCYTIGSRSFNTTPNLKVTTKPGTQVKKAVARVYKY